MAKISSNTSQVKKRKCHIFTKPAQKWAPLAGCDKPLPPDTRFKPKHGNESSTLQDKPTHSSRRPMSAEERNAINRSRQYAARLRLEGGSNDKPSGEDDTGASSLWNFTLMNVPCEDNAPRSQDRLDTSKTVRA